MSMKPQNPTNPSNPVDSARRATHPNLWPNLLLTLLVLAAPLGTKLILSSASAATSKQVESTAPMQMPRQGHTATPLPDGRVLIVGGIVVSGAVLDSIEIYDRANNSFSAVGNPLAP